jgi:hypothetical protein
MNLKNLLKNQAFLTVVGIILTALLGLWITNLNERRHSLSAFHATLSSMQDELIEAGNESGDRAPSLDTARKLDSTITSELYANSLSLGADNSDMQYMLRATNAQLGEYVRACGRRSVESDASCRNIADLLGESVGMLVEATQRRLYFYWFTCWFNGIWPFVFIAVCVADFVMLLKGRVF